MCGVLTYLGQVNSTLNGVINTSEIYFLPSDVTFYIDTEDLSLVDEYNFTVFGTLPNGIYESFNVSIIFENPCLDIEISEPSSLTVDFFLPDTTSSFFLP